MSSTLAWAREFLPRPRFRSLERRSRYCLLAALAGSIVSLGLRWVVPLNPAGLTTWFYDDSLYERTAISLSQHNWLGRFDRVTLAKGPSYPIFIAVNHWLHIPLQVGEQLTYLLAGLCLAGCVWLVTRRIIAATAVYIILAFEPANFNWASATVIRDNWYAALSLLFLSSLFLAVYCAHHRARIPWLLSTTVLAGLSGATLWLCREEGAWIIASAVVIVIGLPLVQLVGRHRLPGQARRERRLLAWRVGRVALAYSVMAVSLYAPIAYVDMKNQHAYGVDATTDLASGAFPQAYAAWSRVRGVTLVDFVPIDHAQREVTYAVSPAARELAANLEDPANPWMKWGCAGPVCNDYLGGAEVWALRDAAMASGNFASEKVFQSFFARLGNEINHACADGQLRCAAKLPPALGPLERASVVPVLKSSAHWLDRLVVGKFFYTPFTTNAIYVIPDKERARIAQGISGVPVTQGEAAAQGRRFASVRWLYGGLADVYLALFVLLLIMTVLGLGAARFARRDHRRNLVLWVLAGSLAIGVAVRLLLFSVIGTTQYAVDPRYHYATRTLLLCLATIGGANAVAVLRARLAVVRSSDPDGLDQAPLECERHAVQLSTR